MHIPIKKTEHHHHGGYSTNTFIPQEEKQGFEVRLINNIGGQYPKTKLGAMTKIFFVKTGSGTFIIDDKEQVVIENTVIIVEPNQTFEYFGESLELVEVGISPENSFEEVRCSAPRIQS